MKGLAILIAVFLIPSSVLAAPLKLPKLYACLNTSGAISVKTRCAGSETKLTAEQIGTPGPKGDTGAAGKLNIASCRKVTNDCQTSNFHVNCSVGCVQGEFMLQHFAIATAAGAIESIIAPDETRYQNGVAGGVNYEYQSSVTASYHLLVEGICCPY